MNNPKITSTFGTSTTVRVSIWGYREDNVLELVELWTTPSSTVLYSDEQYVIPGFLSPAPTANYRVGFVKVYEENPVPVDISQ